MKIGLIGLPNSGKTTIFNALTNSESEVTAYANTKVEPNQSQVKVGDERVDKLSKIYQPQKTTYANIEMIDFVGLSTEEKNGELFSGTAVPLIKNTNVLAFVIRNFEDSMGNSQNPISDVETIINELLLSDLIQVESKLDRINHTIQRGKKTNELLIEQNIFNKLLNQLNSETPLRHLDLTKDEEKLIRGYQFLTMKQMMIILNSDEDNYGKSKEIITVLEENHPTIEFAGKFEMELCQLDDKDSVSMFMEDMGISESATNRLTTLSYDVLGYISFFTVGKDEVRAWTIRKGSTAQESAGTIHTDLSRGFIRAECFHYKDILETESEKILKEKGRFRLEGKDYIVQDGDVMSIRFNV